MTDLDRQYFNILYKILETGAEKNTRAGKVRSIFGEQIKVDLKEGFPLLTTKKMFYKGIFHELIWFLKGDTNIKYLVDNNVHIWDDDAYRHYCSFFKEDRVSKEQFIENVRNNVVVGGYKFGDLGPVYGKQWRSFGFKGKDQIQNIIETLKNNPNDRRMICMAYNPDQIEDMALPPCHVMFQFYTRELTRTERMKIFNRRYMSGELPKEWYVWYSEYSKNINPIMDVPMPDDGSDFDIAKIPKYGLSCMWTQRSCDFPLGVPFNIASYALLTHIIAKIVNMEPDTLIGSFGDCHIYENQIDGVKEQLAREGNDKLPTLKIKKDFKDIEDIEFEDFEIENYISDGAIKFPLSVG